MSDKAACDVLGLGCTAVDDLLYVAAYPEVETKVRVRHRERQCGGLTANALVAASRLGARCAFAGVLGEDEDSCFVADSLAREGVDLSYLVRRPGARPIHSTIIVDEGQRTRTILFDLGGSVGAEPGAPSAAVIQSTRVLFIDHYGIEGMLRAARLARAAGIPVVADFERNEWPGFDELLGQVDHLIVSRSFAARLTGETAPERAVGQLWNSGRQAVVVTGGEQGCWYRGQDAPDQVRRHPAFAVDVVDTTGCGDVFHGAYAAVLARGLDLTKRIRFASAAAALKARRLGAQAGIPTHAEVEQFLEEVTADSAG